MNPRHAEEERWLSVADRRSAVAPAVNAVMHNSGGSGQIGAGVAVASVEVFTKALPARGARA